MILRKPYAFFIKHFKMIHVLLSFLMLYSIYHSKRVLDFFNSYIVENINLKGQELASIYTPLLYQIVPFLIITILIIILVVMALKKKQFTFYVINIISYIYTSIVIQVSKITLSNMASSTIDPRSIRLIRDIVMISFIFQIVGIIIVFIRAIGFDIKKFGFKQDLKDLEINEEDREEFEVEFNFDKNKTTRKIRKKIRFLKYTYKENKLLVHLVIAISVFILIFFGSFYYIKKEKPVKENTYISNNGISLKVNKSYITNTDYKGNVISEDSIFVILKIDIKTNSSNIQQLDVATTKLMVGNYSFIPTFDYNNSFFDFGSVYLGEKLSKDYEKKVLVYEIPKKLKNELIEFRFINKNNMDKKRVKLNINDLTLNLTQYNYNLNEEIDFKDSILSGYKLAINGFDIQKKYKLDYNFCYNNECTLSYEYLVPSVSDNVDKSILKLQGELVYDNSIFKLNDLSDIISAFGVINYSIDGVNKTNKIPLRKVTSTKKKEKNVFYIEVPSEIENSNNISIKFVIKDKIYEYMLK